MPFEAVGPGFYALLKLLLLGAAVSVVCRLWMAHLLSGRLLLPSGRYFHHAYQLLRTPGNMTHELGHALGFLACGYRVEVAFWFNDPAGLGYARSGKPFAFWASPFLARLIASPAPLFAGAFLLQGLAYWLKAPPALLDAFLPLAHGIPSLSALRVGGEALLSWVQTPTGCWQLPLFLLLSFSVGIDMAPSWKDLQVFAWPLCVVLLLVLGLGPLGHSWPVLQPALSTLDGWIVQGATLLMAPLWWALAALVLVAVLLTPLALIFSRWH